MQSFNHNLWNYDGIMLLNDMLIHLFPGDTIISFTETTITTWLEKRFNNLIINSQIISFHGTRASENCNSRNDSNYKFAIFPSDC